MNDTSQKFEVTVVSEDNGKQKLLNAGPGTTIGTIIERIYNWMKLDQQPDDRLRCEENGEDIFPHTNLTLKEYKEHASCGSLVFLFASATGGA